MLETCVPDSDGYCNFDIDFSNAKKVIFIKDKLINIVQ